MKLLNSLYVNPVKTIKKLKANDRVAFVWLVILAGFILGIAKEVQNVTNNIYAGLNFAEITLYFIGSMLTTIMTYFVVIYLIPLFMYKLMFIALNIKGKFKTFAYLLALLGPLYSTVILLKVLLDLILPNIAVLNFLKFSLIGLLFVYIISILNISMKEFFKQKEIRSLILTIIPWLLLFVITLVR
ncbi:hypothetical protein D6777_03415 [Candidatus Woesearchaeota archaeon]|nr:MAG: hypothetical protein D6777_03415 [Candidatus Woesearchaeota archaeon]